MKQKLLLKTMLLLFALIAGSSSAWAGDPETIWSENFNGLAADATPTGPTNIAYAGVTYTCTDGAGTSPGSTKIMNEKLAGGASAPEMMVGKKGKGDGAAGGKFTVVIPLDNYEGTLTLTYYQNVQTLKVSSTTTGVSGGQSLKPSAAGQQTTTFTGITAAMTSITIEFESTTQNNVRLDDIVLTGTKASGKTATTVTINGSPSTEVYMGESVTSPTGATVKAGETTIGSTVTWSSSNTDAATINASTGVITLVGPGSTTIKATFAENATYNGSEASYVLKVYGSYTSLAAVHSAATTTETNAKYTFANEFITYISSDKKNIYISDGTNGMVLYNSTAYSSVSIAVGAKLVGSVYTKLQDYNGTVEFKAIPNADLAALISGSETVTAATKTIDVIAKANQSTLVKIENVQYDATAGAFTDGVNTIKYSTKFNSSTLTNEAIYDITGIIILISNQLYIAPRNADDITLKSSKSTPTSAWYTDSGKGTALATATINLADGAVSYFFDTNSTGTVSYESSETTVATINEITGEITPVGYGTTTIKATTAANGDWYSSEATFTLTVKDDFVDLILPANITFATTGYSNWTAISNLWSGATYAGNTNNSTTKIQMKEDNSVGIVVTSSVGRVKKISIAWNSGTNTNRTLNIFGSNTPYTTVAVGANEESIGSFSSNTPSVTELTVDADKNYGYIRIAAAGGALYLDKIQIEWDKAVRCVEIGQYEWATFVSDQIPYFEGSGINAYIVTGHNGNAITKSDALTTAPANTPLLLNAAQGTYAIPLAAFSTTNVDGNLLKKGTGAAISKEDGKTKYVLGVEGGKATFLKIDGTAATVPTDKAYLEFDEEIAAPMLSFDGEGTTGIKVIDNGQLTIDNYYNLAGQRVAQPTKGLYIVNGKKVVIK